MKWRNIVVEQSDMLTFKNGSPIAPRGVKMKDLDLEEASIDAKLTDQELGAPTM
jgi:hypothetical protein